MLKYSKKKVTGLTATDEAIDLRPFLAEEELRLAKSNARTWTPESEIEILSPETSKKRKRNQSGTTTSKSKRTSHSGNQGEKKPVSQIESPSKRRIRTPEPQLSEYEKMQLVIAEAASEAASSTHAHRSRRNQSTVIQKASTKKPRDQPHPPRRREQSHTKEDTAKLPQSPKVAVYDEWQELLKNAQKEGEAGAGRSRRVSRRLDPEKNEPLLSPHIHLNTPSSASPAPEKTQTQASTTPAPQKHVSSTEAVAISTVTIDKTPVDTTDSAATASSKVNRYEAMQELVKNAEQEAKEGQKGIVKMKTRRSIRSLASDDIPIVKSEIGTVQARYMNNAAVEHPPPSFFRTEKLEQRRKDDKPIPKPTVEEKPLLPRRKSQPQKFAETDVLEENRLFMFAILALEGRQNGI
jgi:hypothetical protein